MHSTMIPPRAQASARRPPDTPFKRACALVITSTYAAIPAYMVATWTRSALEVSCAPCVAGTFARLRRSTRGCCQSASSPDFPAPCTLEMREAQATAVLCLRPLSPVVVVAATLALVVVRRRRAARISGGVAAGESVVATAQSPI